MAKSNARRDDNFIPALIGVNESGETKELQLTDTTLRLKVDSNSNDGTATTGTTTGTVAAAGTAVQLGSNACRRCFIQAYEGNTGTIVVGDVNVVAAAATRQGVALFATQGDWFNVSNTNLLYIDSTQAGDKVSVYFEV